MKKHLFIGTLLTLVALGLTGCEATNSTPASPAVGITITPEGATTKDEPTPEVAAADVVAGTTAESEKKTKQPEPTHITVQHCLIGFKGSVPGKPISRTKEEAKKLATKLLAELNAGADFDEIISKNTDDSPPGIYKMANFGISPDARNEVFARGEMVPAFGDTGFPLEIGEYGLAEFDPKKSKYGWHIVKRVE